VPALTMTDSWSAPKAEKIVPSVTLIVAVSAL